MKFLIVRMRKNGMCCCWSNGDPVERTTMAGVAFSDGIDLMARKGKKTWTEAFQEFNERIMGLPKTDRRGVSK